MHDIMLCENLRIWWANALQVFTNWVNLHLNKKGLEIKDLGKDFADGERLCALMEQLSGKKIPDIFQVTAIITIITLNILSLHLNKHTTDNSTALAHIP